MPKRSSATSRVEAFSDGVFAVAATLLVLGLHVKYTPGRLGHELAQEWPQYATYVVSFVTIGIIWMNHHAQFERIVRVDRTMMMLNLLLLMFVTLIPFPTGLLAQYLHERSDQHVAAAAYATTLLAMSVAFFGTYIWANHARLFGEWIDDRHASYLLKRNSFGLGVYVVAIAMAFVSPTVSLALCGLTAVFYAVPGRAPQTGEES
jgi:uncharacterized membrane protein